MSQTRAFYMRAKQHGYGGADQRSVVAVNFETSPSEGAKLTPVDWEMTMGTSGDHTNIRYSEQDWEYLDTYVGGEPYAGCTEISHNGKVLFSMVYCGEIFASCNTEAVRECLVEALLSPQAVQMWRGPACYASADGELMYICDMHKLETSEFDSNAFRLREYIVHRQTSVKLYEATFSGMMVDRRA